MLRQVIEDPDVTTRVETYCELYDRFRDAWDGLTWLLARTPEIGYTLGLGAQIRVHKQEGHVWSQTPAITVLYEYTDDTVEIRAIRTTPP